MDAMFRSIVVATLLAGIPALVQAQSASAPLIVTATVVSTCRVDVPRSSERSALSTFPVGLTCSRGSSVDIRRAVVSAASPRCTSAGFGAAMSVMVSSVGVG
jgi:hypothetical protein